MLRVIAVSTCGLLCRALLLLRVCSILILSLVTCGGVSSRSLLVRVNVAVLTVLQLGPVVVLTHALINRIKKLVRRHQLRGHRVGDHDHSSVSTLGEPTSTTSWKGDCYCRTCDATAASQ